MTRPLPGLASGPLPWQVAWGAVPGAVASSTTDQAFTSAAFVDLTFASVSWIGLQARLYRITLSIAPFQTVSAGNQSVQIATGTSGVGTVLLEHEQGGTTPTTTYGEGTFVCFQTGTGALTSVHARCAVGAGLYALALANLRLPTPSLAMCLYPWRGEVQPASASPPDGGVAARPVRPPSRAAS